MSHIGKRNAGILVNFSKHKYQIKNFFSRDVELGSLEQTIENQPKFFANSMKVHLNINPPYSLNTLMGPKLNRISCPDDS